MCLWQKNDLLLKRIMKNCRRSLLPDRKTQWKSSLIWSSTFGNGKIWTNIVLFSLQIAISSKRTMLKSSGALHRPVTSVYSQQSVSTSDTCQQSESASLLSNPRHSSSTNHVDDIHLLGIPSRSQSMDSINDDEVKRKTPINCSLNR